MADTETRPQDIGQQSGQANQGQQGQQYNGGQIPQMSDARSQQQIDSLFAGQVNAYDLSTVQQGWQQYFQLAQQTISAAQRVSDLQMLSMQRQSIVSDVTAAVVQQISRNPALLQHVTQQAAQQAAQQVSQQVSARR